MWEANSLGQQHNENSSDLQYTSIERQRQEAAYRAGSVVHIRGRRMSRDLTQQSISEARGCLGSYLGKSTISCQSVTQVSGDSKENGGERAIKVRRGQSKGSGCQRCLTVLEEKLLLIRHRKQATEGGYESHGSESCNRRKGEQQ